MVDVDLQVAAAIGLVVVALALLVSAWFGRALGLIGLAIILTLTCAIAAVVDTPFEGGVGDRAYHPTTFADLESEYRLAIGNLRVDLRDAPLPVGITEITTSLAIGELHVVVPTDVTVVVHAEAGAGQVTVFGSSDDGLSAERDETVRVAGARRLELDARTGAGNLVVERQRVMTRHRFDPFAFIAGALFLALAVGFLLDAVDAWDADPRWIGPVLLITFGLAGLLTTVGRQLRARRARPQRAITTRPAPKLPTAGRP